MSDPQPTNRGPIGVGANCFEPDPGTTAKTRHRAPGCGDPSSTPMEQARQLAAILKDIPRRMPDGLRGIVAGLLKHGFRLTPGSVWVVDYPPSDALGRQKTTASVQWLHVQLPAILSAYEPNSYLFGFPLARRPSPDWKGGKRFFGAERDNGRLHAGCDLLGDPGTKIYAVSDGTFVRYLPKFTGPSETYPKYPVTDAVDIRHPPYLIRYGEIAPDSYVGRQKEGEIVKKGQALAKIGACKMLHFEVYSDCDSPTSTKTGPSPYFRRSDVTNPSPLLDQLAVHFP